MEIFFNVIVPENKIYFIKTWYSGQQEDRSMHFPLFKSIVLLVIFSIGCLSLIVDEYFGEINTDK